MDKNCLPSFFVVGAQKAGTTSLHDWLSQQPDVSLPSIKETHFFDDDRRYQYGIDWYLKQFRPDPKGCDQVKGEICPDYMFFPQVPERLRLVVKNPRFVFIFRNPIERAFSHFLMTTSRGHEPLEFHKALNQEKARIKNGCDYFSMNHYSYMSRGRYAEQVTRFTKAFPESRVLFIKFEDLVHPDKGLPTYIDVCKFIKVTSDPLAANREKKKNPAGVARSRWVRDFVHKGGTVRHLLSYLIPSTDARTRIKVYLDRLNKKQYNTKPKINYQLLPNFVFDDTLEEISKLEKITKLDLSDWSQKNESNRLK